MNVLELLPWGKGLAQSFAKRGHMVIVADFKDNTSRGGDVPGILVTLQEIRDIAPALDKLRGARWDVIMARPPCPTYSPAARYMRYRNTTTGEPLTDYAREADANVTGMLAIIRELNPRLGWVMENPHGELRKCSFMQGIPIRTVTLCQYSDPMRKATDLFGPIPPAFVPKACKVGATDHLKSDWTDKTKGDALKKLRKSSWERAWLPEKLSEELCAAFESVA